MEPIYIGDFVVQSVNFCTFTSAYISLHTGQVCNPQSHIKSRGSSTSQHCFADYLLVSPLPRHKEAVQPEATAATPSGGTRQSYVHIALLPHEHTHAQGGYYLSAYGCIIV